MPNWRALLRLKSERSPTQRQKATPQPRRFTHTSKAEAPPLTSRSTTEVHQNQPPPERPASGAAKTADKVSSSVASGLKLALRLLKEAVTGIGVPGLEAAVGGVVKVIDIIENVRHNDRDLESLSRRISGVATAVSKSPSLHPKHEVPEGLRLRMETFLRELQVLLDEVEDILSDRNFALRTANSEANRDAITEINASIDQLIGQFTAEGVVSLELNMTGARQDVRAVIDKVDEVKQGQIAQEYEALIEKIPRVHARYNDTSTKPSRACHHGTRTELLQGINSWIEGGADDTPYLWLCGEVGVGKTTVAHTIAKEQEGLKQLGASFFFSRHDSGRQDPHRLFPSLAYQLARFDRGMLRALAEILQPDPDIVNRGLTEQFTKLILEPLSRSGMASSRTVVIVIDGLDECSDSASVLDALAIGAEYVGVRLRVLVCSRPYAAIQSKFKFTPLYHLASQTHFHDINSTTLSNDVAAFLTWSLREIGSRPANRNLPTPWPAEDQLKELISRASGLFIIASTYAKYIDDPVEGNPAAQLRRILSRKRGIGSSPLAELDALYDQVLDDLRRSLKTADELAMARDIVETVILAKSEMSMDALSGLLCMEPSDVRSVLRRLTAVILLPEDEDAAITPFHASFGEYIQHDARCSIRELSVDTASAHNRIATRCISAISSATRNGITGVEYHMSNSVPLHLEYASEHLAEHIGSSPRSQAGEENETAMEYCIWTWLNLLYVLGYHLLVIKRTLRASGFRPLLDVQVGGIDPGTSSAATALKMTANHVLAINRESGICLEPATSAAEVSVAARRSKGLQVIKFNPPDDDQSITYVLNVVVDARYWNKLNHPDMFIHAVTIDGDVFSPKEVRLLVSSSSSLRGICSLSEYLEKIGHENIMSKIRLALKIAKGVQCIHETSPLQAHGWLAPDTMLVSAEGKPILAPCSWSATGPSEGPENDDSFDCQMARSSDWWSAASHWRGPGPIDYRSKSARQSEDIWAMGSILFLMMTGTQALPRYKQFAKGQLTLGYDESEGDVPVKYWEDAIEGHLKQARFETAVSLLLETIDGYEELKAVLKACWAFKPRGRPSMRVVARQLDAIIRAAGNVL